MYAYVDSLKYKLDMIIAYIRADLNYYIWTLVCVLRI